jgi:hypothetical protein
MTEHPLTDEIIENPDNMRLSRIRASSCGRAGDPGPFPVGCAADFNQAMRPQENNS